MSQFVLKVAKGNGGTNFQVFLTFSIRFFRSSGQKIVPCEKCFVLCLLYPKTLRLVMFYPHLSTIWVQSRPRNGTFPQKHSFVVQVGRVRGADKSFKNDIEMKE